MIIFSIHSYVEGNQPHFKGGRLGDGETERRIRKTIRHHRILVFFRTTHLDWLIERLRPSMRSNAPPALVTCTSPSGLGSSFCPFKRSPQLPLLFSLLCVAAKFNQNPSPAPRQAVWMPMPNKKWEDELTICLFVESMDIWNFC